MVYKDNVQTFTTLFGSGSAMGSMTQGSLRPVISIIDSVHGLI